MRKSILVLLLAIAVTVVVTACTTYRGTATRSGCKETQGYVGYGGR